MSRTQDLGDFRLVSHMDYRCEPFLLRLVRSCIRIPATGACNDLVCLWLMATQDSTVVILLVI